MIWFYLYAYSNSQLQIRIIGPLIAMVLSLPLSYAFRRSSVKTLHTASNGTYLRKQFHTAPSCLVELIVSHVPFSVHSRGAREFEKKTEAVRRQTAFCFRKRSCSHMSKETTGIEIKITRNGKEGKTHTSVCPLLPA